MKLLNKGDSEKAMYVLQSIERTMKINREYDDSKRNSR
jgi:hypothetical protein